MGGGADAPGTRRSLRPMVVLHKSLRHFSTKWHTHARWENGGGGRLVKDGGTPRWFRLSGGGGAMMWDEVEFVNAFSMLYPTLFYTKSAELSRFCSAVPPLLARGYRGRKE